VAFSPDGRVLATGHPGGRVRLYDAATGTELDYPVSYRAAVRAAVFCAGGRCLAVGDARGAVSVTDVAAARRAFWNDLLAP
jgi:WD40 repeat protein